MLKLKKEYSVSLLQTALQRFNALLAQAQQCGLDYPNAMSVSTVNAQGQATVRTILLKGVDDQAFVFYTNKNSRKAQDLRQNPRVGLLFYWQCLKQQVLIEGKVTDVSDAEADAYWLTRPEQSRIGAWASHQSDTLDARASLEQRYAKYAAQFSDGNIPRPAHWSGYKVIPHKIEFWTEGEFRLHERLCYENVDGVWTVRLLNP